MKAKKVLVVTLFVLLSYSSFPQSAVEPIGKEKQVYHSIDMEPFALGYTISQKISDKCLFGIGFQAGASLRYFLNNPYYVTRSISESDSTSYDVFETKRLKPTTKFSIEIVQVKVFYRYLLSTKCYINIGGYWGYGILMNGNMYEKNHSSLGVIGDFFWGSKHFKIGSRLQIGNTHISYNANQKSNSFSVLVTPIVLQIYF